MVVLTTATTSRSASSGIIITAMKNRISTFRPTPLHSPIDIYEQFGIYSATLSDGHKVSLYKESLLIPSFSTEKEVAVTRIKDIAIIQGRLNELKLTNCHFWPASYGLFVSNRHSIYSQNRVFFPGLLGLVHGCDLAMDTINICWYWPTSVPLSGRIEIKTHSRLEFVSEMDISYVSASDLEDAWLRSAVPVPVPVSVPVSVPVPVPNNSNLDNMSLEAFEKEIQEAELQDRPALIDNFDSETWSIALKQRLKLRSESARLACEGDLPSDY